MTSEREDFNLSGPLHLNNVDWKNEDHRRSVAACLVQGVYILERDRQDNRRGPQALAPLWWEFFHFRLHRELVDDVDQCIFGSIYEFKPPFDGNHLDGSPRYAIAFRGTLTKGDAFLRDLEMDVHIIRNGLHQTSRFETAIQAVRSTVATHGSSNIWLAGHSLGAAMAILAGKTMAKTGIFLEAFLFNPPFLNMPIERIKDKKVKQGIRIASSFIAAGLTVALKARQKRNIVNTSEDHLAALSAWFPSLFVHPGDHICSGYIGYFEHRKQMEAMGAGVVERLASQNPIGGLLMNAMGKDSGEPLHLLPSANLIVNSIPAQDFKQAHGIHQWWQPDLSLQSIAYNYK
ncbi:GDSL esterase/lipase At4g10955 [Diospyros lotus]|uniref:GDSL esterase/lipase At4g10955 n=1 Tax=Diospyros lotus TaxID=55363 RepID=UPI00225BB57D|nr:GDSL esterase/lipase At4g10955 [Diospyros lotus]